MAEVPTMDVNVRVRQDGTHPAMLTQEEYVEALREWHQVSREWTDALAAEMKECIDLRGNTADEAKVVAEARLRENPQTMNLLDRMYQLQVKVDIAERLTRYPMYLPQMGEVRTLEVAPEPED